MRLTDAQITKYQKIYKDIYGKTISKDKALEQGLALLRIVKVISQPQNINEMEKNNEPTKLHT